MKKKLILFYLLFTSFFSIQSQEAGIAATEQLARDKSSFVLLLQLADKYINPQKEKDSSYLSSEDTESATCLLRLSKKDRTSIKEEFNTAEQTYKNYHLFNLPEQLLKDQKDQAYIKLILLTEALYLTASTETDLQENNTLYKQLSLFYHTDRLDRNTQYSNTAKESFKSAFVEFVPLLSDDINGAHLNSFTTNINTGLNKKLKHMKEHQLSPFILIPYAISTRSLSSTAHFIAAKTVLNLFPNKKNENKCRKELSYLFRKTALKAESELININSQLPVNLRMSSIT